MDFIIDARESLLIQWISWQFLLKKKSAEELVFLKDDLATIVTDNFCKKDFKEIDGARKLILFDGKFLNTDEKTTVFNFREWIWFIGI